jgi:hypothetical protein
MNVTFILPGHGGGGGAHSVVQESVGLKQFGVRPAIATTEHTMDVFRANYPELDEAGVDIVVFQDAKDLADALVQCDLAVATTYESLHLLRNATPLCGNKKLRTAYYVQDYEPFFVAPGTPEWTRARTSYSAMPDQLLFAKTDWLCDVVRANHGQPVTKVSPSIDHKTYYPGPEHTGRRPTICAMIRPKTPRRAPRRTARILEQIAEKFDDKVELLAFGASPEELIRNGIRTSERITQSGHLSARRRGGGPADFRYLSSICPTIRRSGARRWRAWPAAAFPSCRSLAARTSSPAISSMRWLWTPVTRRRSCARYRTSCRSTTRRAARCETPR